jgi:four helix bundle protein
MDETELKQRTKRFGIRCIKLADTLPNTFSGRTAAGQLARSGTSVGANYRSACRARSKAEFISKLGVVEEETDETAFWLEIVIESDMKPAKLVGPLHGEAEQLVRITAKSFKTACASIQNPKSKIQNR